MYMVEVLPFDAAKDRANIVTIYDADTWDKGLYLIFFILNRVINALLYA